MASALRQSENLKVVEDKDFQLQTEGFYNDPEWYQEGNDRGIQWESVYQSTIARLYIEPIIPTHISHPWEFYGVHLRGLPLLRSLEADLQVWIEGLLDESKSPQIKHFRRLQLSPGQIVACKGQNENKWVRGKLVRKVGDCEDYDVYLVDYGDYLSVDFSQLLPIKQEFVARLPFQAMRFSLGFIKPTGSEDCWDDDAIEFFQDLIFPRGEQITLNVAVVENSPYVTEEDYCLYYEAVAFIGKNPVCGTLVQKKMAVYSEDVPHVLKVVKDYLNPVVRNAPAVNEDDEDWEASPEVVNNLDIRVIEEPSPSSLSNLDYYSGTGAILGMSQESPPEPRLPSNGFKGKGHRHQRYWH